MWITGEEKAVSNLDQKGRVQQELHFVTGMSGLPMLLMAAAMFVTGVFVLSRERPSPQTWSFLFLAVTVALWLSSLGLLVSSADQPTARTLARCMLGATAFIPAAVLQFTAALLHRGRALRWLLAACWTTSAYFSAIFVSTNRLLGGVWHYSWGFYPRLERLSATFLTYFVIVLAGSLLLLAAAQKSESSEQEAKRIRSFIFALGVGYLGSIDWLPAFGLDFYPSGFVAIAAFIGLAVDTIHRFRLSDLSPGIVAGQLLKTMEGGVIVVDLAGRIRLVNATASALLGHAESEMLGADLGILLQQPTLPATTSTTFSNGGRTRNRPMLWRRADGTSVEVAVSAVMLRDETEMPMGILYIANDITERRRAERAEFIAHHDPLTSLPNRNGLRQRFDEMIEQVAQRGRTATLFFLDLDGFKNINDQHGHDAGDRVLKQLATRLTGALRDDDLVARYGGDEFVVLVNLRSAEDSGLVAQKIVRAVNEPYVWRESRLRVGTSIGAAFYPHDGGSLDELIHASDKAMYEAKRIGRNQFRTASRPRPRPDDIEGPPPFNVEARS
jgi:diguanylate cyclase (GGDEF)-like protein/PAS domain S-box-containing protein